MRILLVFCIFIITSKNYSQQSIPKRIDSLEKWLQKNPKQDTAYIKTLIDLNSEYLYVNDGKLEVSSQKLLSISQKSQNSRGICRALFLLSNVEEKKGNYIKALSFAQQSAQTSEKHQLYRYHADALSSISRIYGLLNNQKEHIEYALKEYDYSTKIPIDKISPKELLTNKIVSSSNVSLAYISLKQPKKALQYALLADYACEEYNQKFKESYKLWYGVLYNVALAYVKLENYEKAEEYMKKSYEKMNLIKAQWRSSQLNQMMGIIYLNQNKFKEAEKEFLKGIENLKQSKRPTIDLKQLSLALQEVYAKQHKFKEAYTELLKAKHYSDTIYQEDHIKALSELTIKFETAKKNQQIQLLEANNKIAESQKRQYFYLALGLAIVLFLSLLATFQIRKAKQKTDAANQQRDKLFLIVAHDLRSPVANLQHITSTIGYVLKKNNPKDTYLLSQSIEDTATTLYKLVDNLLQWSLLQYGGVFLNKSRFVFQYEIEEIISTLRNRAEMKQIDLKFLSAPLIEISADRMSVQTIIRNLLDNAIKFTPINGTIIISIRTVNNTLQIRITDNGVGIPIAIQKVLFENNAPAKSRLGTYGEKGVGVGLYVCRELAVMNKGDLQLINSNDLGSTFLLTLPL